MSQEVDDEITSINSIYGDSTLVIISPEPLIVGLTLPSQPSISLRVEISLDYPDVPPSILGTQSVGSDVARGQGSDLVGLVRNVLSEVYVPGSPCIFDLIEELEQRLSRPYLSPWDATDDKAIEDNDVDLTLDEHDVEDPSDRPQHGIMGSKWAEPPWTISEVVSEKKSVFVARAAEVDFVDQAKQFLAHLLATDKKVAKATHNITAWRIRREDGVQFQDCDDDGENAAGGRLLHLLELMGVWNAMVVVTRWFGGVHLGPDRFRIINQTARNALVKGGFDGSGGKDGGKKKGKK